MSSNAHGSALLDEANKLPPLASLMTRAAAAPKRIVFAEGSDPRIVEAAVAALNAGILKTAQLVGPQADVEATLAAFPVDDPSGIEIHDPENSRIFEALAERFVELRAHKGLSLELARKAALDPLVFAALLVETDRADGSIGGAVATTSDTVRAALQVIGKAKSEPLVSSFFLMILPEDHALGRPAMVLRAKQRHTSPHAKEFKAKRTAEKTRANEVNLQGEFSVVTNKARQRSGNGSENKTGRKRSKGKGKKR